MVLRCILGSLAVLSQLLLLWQWLAARRFPLHRRSTRDQFKVKNSELEMGAEGKARSALRGITVLKPLRGADESTAMCLRSWLTQDYAGPVQILFGVVTADDPAAAVVRKLLAEFPKADAQLLVCPEPLGANAKVAKLIQLERLAKHEFICVSDADVRVPGDFLAEAVGMLDLRITNYELRASGTLERANSSGASSRTGKIEDEDENEDEDLTEKRSRTDDDGVVLVNCFYRLANPTTLAMQCEAVAINADFWSQVLQSCSLKPMDFSLGAAMVTRRTELAAIGGFAAIKDCLADDYQLGNRMVRSGTGVSRAGAEETHGRDARATTKKRIAICPVVVECWDAPMNWAAVWKHQLRWARTIRVCQPGPYFFSILSNPTFWPVLWASMAPSQPGLVFLAVALIARVLITADLQRRLAGEGLPGGGQFRTAGQMEPSHVGCYGAGWWLAPVKDLLQVVVWVAAFAGNTIEWRGRRMKVRRDGTLAAEVGE